jgi:hypothetical protein
MMRLACRVDVDHRRRKMRAGRSMERVSIAEPSTKPRTSELPE